MGLHHNMDGCAQHCGVRANRRVGDARLSAQEAIGLRHPVVHVFRGANGVLHRGTVWYTQTILLVSVFV